MRGITEETYTITQMRAKAREINDRHRLQEKLTREGKLTEVLGIKFI